MSSNAGSQHGQLNGFGNGVEPNRNGNKTDTVPKKKLAEGVTLGTGNRIQPDSREHQSNAPRNDAFKLILAAESGHEGDPQEREHEEFGRAEGEN